MLPCSALSLLMKCNFNNSLKKFRVLWKPTANYRSCRPTCYISLRYKYSSRYYVLNTCIICFSVGIGDQLKMWDFWCINFRFVGKKTWRLDFEGMSGLKWSTSVMVPSKRFEKSFCFPDACYISWRLKCPLEFYHHHHPIMNTNSLRELSKPIMDFSIFTASNVGI